MKKEELRVDIDHMAISVHYVSMKKVLRKGQYLGFYRFNYEHARGIELTGWGINLPLIGLTVLTKITRLP